MIISAPGAGFVLILLKILIIVAGGKLSRHQADQCKAVYLETMLAASLIAVEDLRVALVRALGIIGTLDDAVAITADLAIEVAVERLRNGRLYEGDTLDQVYPDKVPFGKKYWTEDEPQTAAGLK